MDWKQIAGQLAQALRFYDREPHIGCAYTALAAYDSAVAQDAQSDDNQTPPCKTDPRAPHGFDRTGSHSADRYVCECEWWNPPPPDTRVEELERARAAEMQAISEVREVIGLFSDDKLADFDRTQERIERRVAELLKENGNVVRG